MMKRFAISMIAAAAIMSAAVPAKASIVFSTGASGTGDNVLFGSATGGGTNTLTTTTNKGDSVTFTSTTGTLTAPSSGQARLVAGTGSLDELMWFLTDTTKGFTTGVFNIDTPKNGGATSVTIYAQDQSGVSSQSFSLSGNGQNFFTISSNGGDVIESLKIVMSGGTVDDIAQFRLGGIQSISAVPEPSTWAMMLVGFAGLGYLGFRQSRRKADAVA